MNKTQIGIVIIILLVASIGALLTLTVSGRQLVGLAWRPLTSDKDYSVFYRTSIFTPSSATIKMIPKNNAEIARAELLIGASKSIFSHLEFDVEFNFSLGAYSNSALRFVAEDGAILLTQKAYFSQSSGRIENIPKDSPIFVLANRLKRQF